MPTTDEQEQGVRRVYGEIAGVYETFFPSLQRYEGRVERFLGETVAPGRRVLDVGCGPGQLTRELEPTVEVVGLDLSPEMLERAREGRPSGEYRVYSYRDPVPGDLGRFDVALAVGCLDFCDDLARTLGHVSEALKPGGRLLFTVLERRLGLEGHEESWRQVQTEDQEVTLYFWSFEETARALEAASLLPRTYAHGPGWVQLLEQRTMHFGWWDVERR
ncbi:class I SAM-dependent methyltransferase [Archangium violaceum]|uniref:SAM-dependent methyltransferase n=1 Tax=Archangium violaceum Cb vi76 TaxID=1406225 RepID=A0A084SJW4_9BACT|nr:class I SAM-dependent methyltransferase [Archangium violaceum]KFA88749.1 SAM-dependent methyltransferase [Archangium violaceum Cb vi76]